MTIFFFSICDAWWTNNGAIVVHMILFQNYLMFWSDSHPWPLRDKIVTNNAPFGITRHITHNGLGVKYYLELACKCKFKEPSYGFHQLQVNWVYLGVKTCDIFSLFC